MKNENSKLWKTWRTCIIIMMLFAVAIGLHYYASKYNYDKLNTKIDNGFNDLNTRFDDLEKFLNEPIETNFIVNPK